MTLSPIPSTFTPVWAKSMAEVGGEKVFLKKQTFICLSLPKILGLKMQEILKTEKKRIPSEAR